VLHSSAVLWIWSLHRRFLFSEVWFFLCSTLMELNARLINTDIVANAGLPNSWIKWSIDVATRVLLIFNMGIILVNLCIFYFFSLIFRFYSYLLLIYFHYLARGGYFSGDEVPRWLGISWDQMCQRCCRRQFNLIVDASTSVRT
jgi:hypothetical protein